MKRLQIPICNSQSPALILLLCGLSMPASADETFFVRRGSTWKYLPGVEEASTPDTTAWRGRGFDDVSWASGPAPFGFGLRAGPFGTMLTDMLNNYSSLYLRQTFEVASVPEVATLHANVDFDDGFVIWLNGVEVVRANVRGAPGEPVAHNDTALRGHDPGTYQNFELPDPVAAYLVDGTNVLAVQAFNASRSSSDFKIDLELVDPFGPDRTAPTVTAQTPAAGITVRRLAQVEVTFSEVVSGVDAADLLVNGLAASQVSGAGRGPYIFRVPEPAAGLVEVTWTPDHGISDLAEPPNVFAGGGWTYTLDPAARLGDLVISEFLAANRSACRRRGNRCSAASGLCDEDCEASDWIEIHNPGPVAVDLTGWGLTDDRDEPGKWTFPALTLGSGEYLVVFASGKDRRPQGGDELHTNFKLNNSGEYLGLSTPESPRAIVSEFAPRYPEQRVDISYGADAAGKRSYFDPPTPRDPNTTEVIIAGIVSPPLLSVPHGFYEEPFALEILNVTPGAAVYYTLDGSEPTPSTGTRYAEPIEIAAAPRKAVVTLRAAAYKEGYLPSRTVTRTYIFLRHVPSQPADPEGFPARWGSAPAADYEMDPEVIADSRELVLEGLLSLPTLSIVMNMDDMFGRRGLYSNSQSEGIAWEKACSAELIYPDGSEGFQVNCGIRIHGGASRLPEKSPKHGLRLIFRGAYGPTKLRFPLFPGSPVESFDTVTLRSNFNNSWVHWDGGQRRRGSMIRDQWARDSQLAMSGLSSRGTYAHLYINGLYWGVYNAVERPSAPFAAAHLGGEKEEYDALNSSEAVDGDTRAWRALLQLARRSVRTNEGYLAVQERLDIPHFIDYMIVNIYGGNDDWPHHNWYAVRRRQEGARFRFISWDAEHILKGVGASSATVSNDDSPGVIYSRLRPNREFALLFADHVHRHFFNGGALTPEAAAARWTARAEELYEAVLGEEARWGDYRRDVHRWRNPPYEFYRRETHWLEERERLMTRYFPRRGEIVLRQFRNLRLYPSIGAPVFSHDGGAIEPGFTLTMSLPEGTVGTIYYTTDGSDPRVFGAGEVSPTAAAYAGPLLLTDRAHVKARTLGAAGWSALNEAIFTTATPREALRITEILYNPRGGSAYEFIEIQNTAATTVDLSGVTFTNGVNFTFPRGSAVGPGEFAVLVSDPDAFASVYPNVPSAGAYRGNLANGGERLTLADAERMAISSVAYDDERFWPIAPDGLGHSLVLADPGADPDQPSSWRASALLGGSPGAEDPPPLHGGVVINEVLTRSAAPLEDAVELHNPTSRAIEIGGWFLSDSRRDRATLRKFRIPDATPIPAGGSVVFYEYQFNREPGLRTSFALNASGDDIYLSAADSAGNLSGYIVGQKFAGALDGVSFGRHATSTGQDFTALSERTFGVDGPATVEEFRSGAGASNAPPWLGAVVINEVHYHPLGGDLEFVELYNRGREDVALHDEAIGRGFKLGGVRNAEGTDSYEFPPATVIPAGGFLLLVPIDPEAFRGFHGLPVAVAVAGPYGGALSNGGERLELSMPALPGDGELAYIVVDHLRYDDVEPWPLAADGRGPSLERVRASDYGNEVLNWAASIKAGGTPGATNSVSKPEPRGGGQIPGDSDQDGRLNISDAVSLLSYLFLGGRPPPCDGATIVDGANTVLLDLDLDHRVNLGDAVFLLNYLFRRGPLPALGSDCVPIEGCPEVCGV